MPEVSSTGSTSQLPTGFLLLMRHVTSVVLDSSTSPAMTQLAANLALDVARRGRHIAHCLAQDGIDVGRLAMVESRGQISLQVEVSIDPVSIVGRNTDRADRLVAKFTKLDAALAALHARADVAEEVADAVFDLAELEIAAELKRYIFEGDLGEMATAGVVVHGSWLPGDALFVRHPAGITRQARKLLDELTAS